MNFFSFIFSLCSIGRDDKRGAGAILSVATDAGSQARRKAYSWGKDVGGALGVGGAQQSLILPRKITLDVRAEASERSVLVCNNKDDVAIIEEEEHEETLIVLLFTFSKQLF